MVIYAGWDLLAQRRQERFHAVRHRNGVRPRLPLNRQNDGTVAVVPARYFVVLDIVEHLAELVEVHRRAVSVGDDHLPELLGVLELSIGFDGGRFVETPEGSCGHAYVLRPNCRCYFVNANPAAGHGVWVELDMDGIGLGAIDKHLGGAVHHRDALRQDGLAVVIHGRERQSVRGKRHEEDGLIGGVDLVIGGRRGHVRRQLARRFADGGLNVLRGGVNVPAERKLDRDLGQTEGADRGHRIHSGDGRELAFEGGGHGRSHRFGTCARQTGLHQNRWIIDAGEVADRQKAITEQAKQKNARHDQGGHDRPANE